MVFNMNHKFSKTFFLFLIFIFCFLSIVNISYAGRISDIDRDIFGYVHEDMNNKYLDEVTPIIQYMGDPRFYFGLCAFLCAFGDEKMSETGKLAFTGYLGAGGIIYIFKETISRPRPLNIIEKNSFPSGHTTFAFTLAIIAGHQYPKLRIPLYLGAVGTAFSRVYLGRHYPSDVLAGAIIGVLTGVGIIYFNEPILRFSF
jgi:undecaprenyl-diphosphatase